MKHVHRVVMDHYKEGKGVEGNVGIYDRVQHLKTLLADELTPRMIEKLDVTPKNKILMVIHSRVL